MRLRSLTAMAGMELVFVYAGGVAFATDLTLPTGGRVSIELLTSESGSINTLAVQNPGVAVAVRGCTVEQAVGLPGLRILSEEAAGRGCRVQLDADEVASGVQPFAAGTVLRFGICPQPSFDDPNCLFVWSSNPALNADGFDHLRTTPLHAAELPGRIFELAWEDESGGGDNDFDDLVAVLRVDADSDGDGLWDDWEAFGIDADGDGNVDLDLPALGANPLRKDIFLEIDYMVCVGGFGSADCLTPPFHSHRPKDAAVALVVDAFADAPVANPDGSTGISLHVDVSNSLPHQDFLILSDLSCGDPAGTGIGSFDDVKADPANFGRDNPRRFAFHYSIWGHRKSPVGRGRSSGCAEIPGNDSLVTLGDWNTRCVAPGADGVLNSTLGGDDIIISVPDPDGTGPLPIPREIYTGDNLRCDSTVNSADVGFTPVADVDGDGLGDLSVGTLLEQAGTLMHELGHNLELQHGGDDGINGKPNYLSIMNYLFQTDGIPLSVLFATPPRIDYSRVSLPTLREFRPPPLTSLNEAVGIQDGIFNRTRFFCPTGAQAIGAGSGPIDWNCDGDGGLDTDVAVNLNGDKVFNQSLFGFDDWSALRLDMQSARDFADGSSESSEELEENQDVIQLEIPQLVQIDITPGELPNSVNPRAGGKLPVAILSETGFSAPEHVASDTLRFGRSGDEASLAFCNLRGEDVNEDGLLDLVCHFTRRLTGFAADSAVGTLRGQTIWGKVILGTAPVRIVSP